MFGFSGCRVFVFFYKTQNSRESKTHHAEHSGFLFISPKFFSGYLQLCRSPTYSLFFLEKMHKCILGLGHPQALIEAL